MKRGKLLLSLSLISLAIAILCFGVLSAVTVNYGISGNITYSIKDVFVKINTRVYKIAEQQDKATVIANVKELETTPLASISTSKYTLSQTMVEYDSTNADTETVTHTAKDSSGNTIQIAYGDYYTYYIVINIKNLTSAKSNVCAYLTDNTTGDTNSVKTTNLYQNNIASTDTKNIVIAYSIKDKTSEVTSVAIDYSLKVSYETGGYTNPITITNDTTNSYYYVTLGTGKVLTGTSNTVASTNSDIKWRLVSLDGVNKYTYNSSDNFEARYLSDAMFVQETAVNSTLAFDSSNSNNYYNSSIRKSIKDGSYFNLTSSNLGYIKDRDLGKIWKYYDVNKQSGYMERDKTDETKDKFWLLSVEEFLLLEINGKAKIQTGATTYKEVDARVWNNYDVSAIVTYWLRNANTTMGACKVDAGNGVNWMNSSTSSERVRAGFQMA